MTAEERRDAAIAEVLEAGGVVTAAVPLATPEDPHTVAAYRLEVGAPDLATRTALRTVRRETEHAQDGLIEWTPAPQPEPVYEDVEYPVEGEPGAEEVA